MHLANILPVAALLASTATAATFNNFQDISCQIWGGTYATATKADLEKLVQEGYAAASPESYASTFISPEDKKKCPPNSEKTYKWIYVPQWYQGYPDGPGYGAAVAAIYYKETDTYNLCDNMGNVQSNGYAGLCKTYV